MAPVLQGLGQQVPQCSPLIMSILLSIQHHRCIHTTQVCAGHTDMIRYPYTHVLTCMQTHAGDHVNICACTLITHAFIRPLYLCVHRCVYTTHTCDHTHCICMHVCAPMITHVLFHMQQCSGHCSDHLSFVLLTGAPELSGSQDRSFHATQVRVKIGCPAEAFLRDFASWVLASNNE